MAKLTDRALFLLCILATPPAFGRCPPAVSLSLENQGSQKADRYQAAQQPRRMTVCEALRSERHDEIVEISGVVLRQTGPASAIIHDGTAAIEITIPPAQIPAGGLKRNSRIRLRGEISDDGHDAHEVEVTELFWSF